MAIIRCGQAPTDMAAEPSGHLAKLAARLRKITAYYAV